MAAQLFRNLLQAAASASAGEEDQHDRVLALCKQLATDSSLTREQQHLVSHLQLTALILSDQFDQITDSLLASVFDSESQDTPQDDGGRFLKAYALYRMNRDQEALDLLLHKHSQQQEETEDEKCRILEAQIRYRMGDYSQAAKLFANVSTAEEDSEFQTNLLACCLFANQRLPALEKVTQRALATLSSSLSGNFDLGFNAILMKLTGQSPNGGASRRLSEDVQKWIASLKKICPEDEKANLEQLVQLAGCSFASQGAEGDDEFSRLQHRQNKLITKFSNSRSMQVEDRLENRKIFAQALQFLEAPPAKQPAKEESATTEKSQLASKKTAHRALLRKILRNCAVLARQDSTDLRSIISRLRYRAPSDITAALALSDVDFGYKIFPTLATTAELQHWVALRNLQRQLCSTRAPSLAELELLPPKTKVDARVVRVLLEKSRRNPERVDWRRFAEKAADDAIVYWTEMKNEDAASRIRLERGRHFFLRADFKLAMQDIETFLNSKLAKQNPEESAAALSIYVRAAARVDPSKAEKWAMQLSSPDLRGLDSAKLESIPLSSLQKTRRRDQLSNKEKEKRQAANALAKRKKRHTKKAAKRREKFAAQIAAGKRVDPERWLPLKERSASVAKMALQARSKRNSKRNKQITGAQGFAVTDATKQLQQSLDHAAKAAAGPTATPKPSKEEPKLPPHLRKLQRNPAKPRRR